MEEDTNALIIRLAEQRGVSGEALRKWHVRGHVPHKWRLLLIETARAEGKELDSSAFENFARPETVAAA